MIEIKEIFKDLVYYIPAKILPSLVNFLSLSAYTYLLTPDEYGNYTIVISTATLVSSIAITWISQANIRLFEKYNSHKELEKYFSTNVFLFLIVNLITSLIWLLIVFIIKNKINPQLFFFLKIGTLYLFFDSGFSFVVGFLRVQRESKKFMKINLIKFSTSMILSVSIMYLFNFGAEIILLSVTLLNAGIFIFLINEFRTKWTIKISNFSKAILKNAYKYGIPLSLTAVGALAISLSDRYLIQYFLNSRAVGIYSAGYRLAQMSILLFSGILIFSAYPILIKTYENSGKQKTREVIKHLTSIYILTMVPILIMMVILSKDIVVLFLGEQYFLSYKIIPFVSGSAFILGLTQYVNKSFELTEKTNKLFYFLIITAFINILLNIILIPKLGFVGAGYTAIISYFIYLLISWHYSKSVLRWNIPWKVIIKVLIASAISAFPFVFFNIQLKINVISIISKTSIIFILYLSILILLKEELTMILLNKILTIKLK